jgi:hypothetical protein
MLSLLTSDMIAQHRTKDRTKSWQEKWNLKTQEINNHKLPEKRGSNVQVYPDSRIFQAFI